MGPPEGRAREREAARAVQELRIWGVSVCELESWVGIGFGIGLNLGMGLGMDLGMDGMHSYGERHAEHSNGREVAFELCIVAGDRGGLGVVVGRRVCGFGGT